MNFIFYIVKGTKFVFLPDWAIKTIIQDARRTNSNKNKIFSLSKKLLQNYNPSLSEENFIEAPANLITKIEMLNLFSDYVEQKANIHLIHRSSSP